MNDYRMGTKCVQAGYTPGNGEPRQVPIIQSTTFKYSTSEDMGKLFDLEAEGYFYTRLQNPTNDHVAAKIAAMEGGTAAMLTSSGQAANFFAMFNICQSGDHIVASSSIYGGTFNLIGVTMAKMGITATFVSPDATEEEMKAVLKKVNLLRFLQTQDGLQTKLLEKASNLSGGQCQRLVIARALLYDAAVYIFDEAASNIDVESEELIMDVIHELAKIKTVLLISHRLANVVESDQIYFLKNGEIQEHGKHEELMQKDGEYRHLYESQMALENYGRQVNRDV